MDDPGTRTVVEHPVERTPPPKRMVILVPQTGFGGRVRSLYMRAEERKTWEENTSFTAHSHVHWHAMDIGMKCAEETFPRTFLTYNDG